MPTVAIALAASAIAARTIAVKRRLVGDVRIGGQHRQHRLGAGAAEGDDRAQADGGGGVARQRLGDHVLARQPGTAPRTAASWSAAVTIRMRSGSQNARARRAAAASSDSSPPRRSSCLGLRRRLAGHSRVPPPPARMMAKAEAADIERRTLARCGRPTRRSVRRSGIPRANSPGTDILPGVAVLAGSPKPAAGTRMDELRRDVGAASDAVVRARLRTELAGLLRAVGDLPGALAELRRAADEAPGLGVVRMAVLSAARALPAVDRAAFLVEVGHIARTEIAAWAAAAAEAQSEAGRPVLSARAWLAVAGDNRFPAHQRRAAARHAIRIAAGTLPAEHLAALQVRAAESTGRARLAFLREALVLAGGEGIDRPTRLAVAAAWIEAGGAPARVEALLEAAEKAGGPVADEVMRLRREINRRWRAAGDRAEAQAGNGARAQRQGAARGESQPVARSPPPRRPTRQERARGRRTPPEPTLRNRKRPRPRGRRSMRRRRADAAKPEAKGDAAKKLRRHPRALRLRPPIRGIGRSPAARAGRGGLARRIAEQALRSGALGSSAPRLAAVEAALRQGGLAKQALLLRRTVLEDEAPEARVAALEALIAEAQAAGQAALAATWRKDLVEGAAPRPAPLPDKAPKTPAEYYLAAQRMLIRIPADGDVGPVLALLSHAVAGHAGSDAALAMGESLLRRQAATAGEGGSDAEAPSKPLEARMIDLLRAAFDNEDRPSRHARIADRLAAALELDGDPAAALAVLDRAITAGVLEVLLPLRRPPRAPAAASWGARAISPPRWPPTRRR